MKVSRLIPAGLGALALAGATPASSTATSRAHSATPRAHSAAACRVGNYYGYGYSYLTSLKVSGTGCRTGQALARRHGRVRGWSCATHRLASSKVQYDARVTCHSGRRTVVWTYTENA